MIDIDDYYRSEQDAPDGGDPVAIATEPQFDLEEVNECE